MISVKLSSSRRQGFTLTEIAIVLGVIGIILGSIWVAAGQVNEKARVTRTMSDYGTITQNMTSLLQGGYGIANPPCAANCNITAAMITSKAIPPYIGTTTTASTPWNSTGLIMSWITGSPRTYRISYYNVPRDACLGLLAQATNCTPGQPGCPIAIYTKGVQPALGAFSIPANTASYNIPASPAMTTANADNACAQNTYPGGGAAANSVEFDFTQ